MSMVWKHEEPCSRCCTLTYVPILGIGARCPHCGDGWSLHILGEVREMRPPESQRRWCTLHWKYGKKYKIVPAAPAEVRTSQCYPTT